MQILDPEQYYFLFISVAEPEPELFAGTGAGTVIRFGWNRNCNKLRFQNRNKIVLKVLTDTV
jgi:hypothetical protein